VGSYDITPSDATAANYDITFVNATLKVTKASLTVTADDQTRVAGTTMPTFTLSFQGFVLGDDSSVLGGTPSFTASTSNTVGTYPITVIGLTSATYTLTFVPGTLSVVPAAAKKVILDQLPASATAGSPVNARVTLYDAFGNIATDYAGTVTFSTDDPLADKPDDYTFTGSDAGQGIFTSTFRKAGPHTLKVTDTIDGNLTASASITVTADMAASLAFSNLPAPAIAGTSFAVTVTALDSYGNVATGYTGTVQILSTDPQAPGVLVTHAFTAQDHGVAVLSGITLFQPGVQTLTAADDAGLQGQASVTVTAAAAAALGLTMVPTSAVAGVGFTVQVTAYDAYGNVATGYSGTVQIQSNDPLAGVLATHTFTAQDAGVFTFQGLKLFTAGPQTLYAQDTGSLLCQSDLNVTAGAATQLALSTDASTTAGSAFALKVTALDAYNNVATGYTGTVQIQSSDPLAAGILATHTFTASDQGVFTFQGLKLFTAGGQTLSAKDAGSLSSWVDVTITAAAAAKLTLSADPGAVAGTPFNLTVTVTDAYGNVATGYTGTVGLRRSDGSDILYTFTASDQGVHAFSITVQAPGEVTFDVKDENNPAIATDHLVLVL
jgi:S-adenosylmethionine hydrolase